MQGIEDVLKEFKQIICDVFQYLTHYIFKNLNL